MNSIDTQYQFLLKDILENGVKKEDRTGTGTLSVFGRTIRHNMKEGFPLLTTKKMAVKAMITELKWFLKGDTNIQYLVKNDCNIWNGDAYKRYYDDWKNRKNNEWHLTEEEFAEKIKTDNTFAEEWGELGPIYGHQWRDWTIKEGYECEWVDQIKVLLKNLKENPDSRRLMVNAWNVGDLPAMVLPPCHYGFQVYTRELTFVERCVIAIEQGWMHPTTMMFDVPETHYVLDYNNIPKRAISLMWNQRSVDTFLGLPFNIASYALLLMLFAEEVNMIPEEVIGVLGDTHLYLNHIEQAKEQIEREPLELPTLKLSNVNVLEGEFEYELLNYNPHPAIKAPLSN